MKNVENELKVQYIGIFGNFRITLSPNEVN